MEKIKLVDFFNKINYDLKKDKYKIEEICYFTKTRADLSKRGFSFSYGMEQPFIIKAIIEHYKSEYFFEMGTGRGTASYSAALSKTIKEIITVDIVRFDQKQNTAIGYMPALVSNKDLYDRIDFDEKKKIKFFERNKFIKNIADFGNKFDICFIDGEHDNEYVIAEDISLAQRILKHDAIFIFDDYCLNRFSVKKVVDNFLSRNNNFNSVLIEMRGHLFDNERKEKNEGLVIISTRNLLFGGTT